MTSSIRLKQREIIKFCDDIRKTTMETKKFLESTGNARNISRVTYWFLDGVTNLGYDAKSGRPLLCDENTKCRIFDVMKLRKTAVLR